MFALEVCILKEGCPVGAGVVLGCVGELVSARVVDRCPVGAGVVLGCMGELVSARVAGPTVV